MGDFLDILAKNAKKTISEGYYTTKTEPKYKPLSLKKAILAFNHGSIITEIKRASPTLGMIREDLDIEVTAQQMRDSGAVAISILTEPKHFMGTINTFIKVRKTIKLPLLMKDIILSYSQIDTASIIGADAILLIKALFDRGYCEYTVQETIEYAHSKGMEVLLETHTEDEFSSALETQTDLVGINNRDLKTLKVNINTTCKILQKINPEQKVVVSESGIKTPEDIHLLHSIGVKGFLVGTVLMKAKDISSIIKEFVLAI
jgi:indole-3-glycerol phosphate synthase